MAPGKRGGKIAGSLRVAWRVFVAPWRMSFRALGGGWVVLRNSPSRLARSFPEFPRELRRPTVFSVLFWSALSVTCVSWPFIYFGGDVGAGFFPAVLSGAALAGVWTLLPWNPRSGFWRKMAAPAFLLGVFVIGRALPGASLMFYPIAFANAVFLFRFRRGIAYTGVVFAVILLDLTRVIWAYESSQTWSAVIGNSIIATILFAPVAVFMIGISMPIVEATRRREETETLLADLEDAHAELKEYAGKARELAVSEERARMAREMHDSVGHYLTVVNVQLEAAAKLMNESPDKEAGERVARAKGLASEALSEVRRSVRALKPLAVEGRSTADALSALARDFEGAGPAVSFSVEGEERGLSTDAEITLYRTLQESLTNTLKHAKARRVSASLAFEKERVKLAVADDGDGDGAQEVADGRGFGLSAIRERVEALGGTFMAGNAPEGGFVVEVELPTERSAERSAETS